MKKISSVVFIQIILILFPITLFVFFGFYLYTQQERIIYLPSNDTFGECPALALAEKVTFKGTRMYVSPDTSPVIVLYHGNAGSACDRSFYASLFESKGYGYALVEYTGYGGDHRLPSHENSKNDVRHVIEYFSLKGRDIAGVVGESLGTGLASYHTSLAPPPRLLLITPFTDLKDIAKSIPLFRPYAFLINNAFDNSALLSNYQGKVYIIHGSQDNVVPYTLSKKLYNSLTTVKKFYTIEKAGHNDLFFFPATEQALRDFLTS